MWNDQCAVVQAGSKDTFICSFNLGDINTLEYTEILAVDDTAVALQKLDNGSNY